MVNMKRTNKDRVFPEVALRLRHLGGYIRIARKRRRMTIAEIGERLNIGYQTVVRLEKGDPNVSVASYMSAAWLFGLDSQFTESVHPDKDETGKALELSRLPKRVGTWHKKVTDNDF